MEVGWFDRANAAADTSYDDDDDAELMNIHDIRACLGTLAAAITRHWRRPEIRLSQRRPSGIPEGREPSTGRVIKSQM